MSSRITIVTVVKDDRDGLLATLTSTLDQTIPPHEVLVVDGLSTDGSLELANEFADSTVHVIEGPDAGIYDAMNKGLGAATGDYVWYLNAGDTLHSINTLSDVSDFLASGQYDWVYGAAMPVNARGEQCGPILQGEFTTQALHKGVVHVNHQAMLMSHTLLDRVGGFRPQFMLAAEYDLYLRASAMIRPAPIHKVLAHFRVGGASYLHRGDHVREMGRARREHLQLTGLNAALDSLRTDFLAWRATSPLVRIPAVRALRNSYLERRHSRPHAS